VVQEVEVKMAKAKIHITLKKTIMDAQGQTVQNALHSLGYKEVEGLRIGKYLEMDLEGGDPAVLKQRVEEMCAKLLANPIIEDYEVAIETD
jgi:phosphoribosylformylglycinamidine synthase subunit PurS